ncbi:hypothetical protein PVAND_011776 [Polypedilum vanderplanki]|uniref:RIIa domain-containing protein n=1 Tax=Polypedilum vanderplanki TaxID=319348 RepID=A0A9J6CKN8_POLVA|nr:hypothetical protein PVAND_011776 [Polypedilum vanderplanki]
MPIISPKIPSGLEELMRGLAKSVIKENPDNIYEFAAEYFENLLRERDGTVDQSYKKFATYKVYKKSKLERKKKERDNLNINQNEDNTNQHLINFSSDDHDEKSIGKKILSDTTSMFSPILQEEIPFVSSESEMNATVIQNDIVDGDGVLNIKKDTEDKNDIKTASLDNEKNSAALKIQSTYRGHKVRRDIKEQKILSYEDVEKSDETEKITIVEKDDLDENTNNKSKDQKINSNENKGLNVQSDDIAFEKCTNDNIELKENEKDCNLVLDPEITDANDIKLQDSFKEEKIENAFENILNDNDIGLLELNQENSKVHASLDENIEQETETFSKETLEGNESNKENEVELGRLENSNDIPKKIEKLLTSELSIENSKNNDNSIILNDTKEVLDQKLTGSLIEEDSNNIEIIKASAADEITENNVDIKGENELQINDEKNNFYRPLNDSKENIELIKEKSVEEAICKQKIFSYLEPSQDDQSDGEKKSKISTEIKYEKLQESFSQELEDSLENLESIEKSELLNQRISDTEQEKNISEKSVLIESQNEEQPRNRLENILQESISPYDLIDEVVNETATRKVNELFLNEKFSENTNDDINKILNPELISLKRHDEENNYNDENNKTMDEVLKPEKEESEIPENFLTQQNEFFNDNKRNEGFKEPIATNELDASLLNDPELQDAAVKIQAAFRGHQVRKDKDILTSHELSNEQHAETFDDLPLD